MTSPLHDGLTFLHQLATARARPADALAALARLRARHADLAPDLYWDEEPLDGSFVYDLLLRQPGIGTIAMSLTTDDDQVPLPLRGVCRWRDSELVRVDGRSLFLDEVAVLIDELWTDRRVLDRIVNLAIIRRELETHPVELTDAELQAAVDAFRAARGLDTAEATARWLASRSLELAGLEDLVAQELYVAHTRRRLVGDAARAAVAADPARFDEVSIVGFPVAPADAVRLATEVAGGQFLEVATRALASQPRGARRIVCETFHRHEIVADDLTVGGVAVARLRDKGPYVVRVDAITPIDPTRATDAAEVLLFDGWLAARRARAHVLWHWGSAEAA